LAKGQADVWRALEITVGQITTMIIRKVFIILLCALLIGCTTVSTRVTRAGKALIGFFALLNQEDYLAATAYYGGDYETLIGMNPDVDPSDYVQLWSNACRNNGFACLRVSKATFIEHKDAYFYYGVEFMQSDGSLFSLGACCGEDQASVDPQTTFIYRVLEAGEGGYLIMDLPVYIP
jgi:hypothetical protein